MSTLRTSRMTRTVRGALRVAIVVSIVALGASTAVSAQTCQPTWAPGAGPNIGVPGLNGSVFALTIFDDGTGPALYAGGSFFTAGSVSASNIAKWNGSSWTPLGSGVNSKVNALTVFDDGTGPTLYAGGFFTIAGGVSAFGIAKWDGSSWSPLGSGTAGGVFALTVFDDGTGPALYAGGFFATAGGVSVNNIAKWDGSSWSPLGSGVSGGGDVVHALVVFDDGTGSALYAGGLFTTAGDVTAIAIAKWDGSSWSPLGSGMGVATPKVRALTVFDDGTGSALYAGGDFTTAGGVFALHVAKWNGSSWSTLGSGMGIGMGFTVDALTVFNDGSGPALYAGGLFTSAGGVFAQNIAEWSGSFWSPLGSGVSGGTVPIVNALAVFDDGTGPALFAGGGFTTAGGFPASNIARYAGCLLPVPADLNGDGVVDGADLAALLTQWGACPQQGACSADLNNDGVVNGADLATLLTNWGPV